MTVRELIKTFMPDEINFHNVGDEDKLEDRKVKSFSYDFEDKVMHVVVEERDILLEVMAEMLFEKSHERQPDEGDEDEIANILQDLKYALDNVRMRREIK